jgi:hypothetical protein
MEKTEGSMKCFIKGCKNSVSFILIDGYLFEGRLIHRKEVLVYGLCMKHDSKFHRLFADAVSNKKLAQTINFHE